MRYYKKSKVLASSKFFATYKWWFVAGILLLLAIGIIVLALVLKKIEVLEISDIDTNFINTEDIDRYSQLPMRSDFIYPFLTDGFVPSYSIPFEPNKEWNYEQLTQEWQSDSFLYDRLREDNAKKIEDLFVRIK